MSDNNQENKFSGRLIPPVGVFAPMVSNASSKLDWSVLDSTKEEGSKFARRHRSKKAKTTQEVKPALPPFLLRSESITLFDEKGEEFTVKLGREVRSCFEDGNLLLAVAAENPSLAAPRVDLTVRYLLALREELEDRSFDLSQWCKVSKSSSNYGEMVRSESITLLDGEGEKFSINVGLGIKSCFEDANMMFAVLKDNPHLMFSRADKAAERLLRLRQERKDSKPNSMEWVHVNKVPSSFTQR